uniref:KIB1-4 beta-propeller domain-containing protein n=1 Tax=Fagus sylvatica TaxID=28930 RepID=A0A2N9J3T6_FAGSY
MSGLLAIVLKICCFPLPHSGVVYTEFKLLCLVSDGSSKYLNLEHKILTILDDVRQAVDARFYALVTSNGLVPSWSELPPDVICEIANQLPNFIDIKAIVAVCKPWRFACLETTTRPPFPWLMLSETLNTDIRSFFNLSDSRRYQLVGGKRCWGTPHGWVGALGPDYETHLEHLDSRVRIALPPLHAIRRLAAREEWFRLVHKFILFKDSESGHELSFLVIAIFGPMNRLAFTRVGEVVALNRRGHGEWVIVTNLDYLKFKDVACFNDQIYGLCDNGILVRFDLDAPLSDGIEVIASQPPTEDVGEPQKLYLVL